MKTKTNVIIPLALVISDNLSPAIKTVYAVLKTFQRGKTAAHLNPSIIVTHAEIMTRSNLSKTTVTKALNQLKANGWVDWETNSVSDNLEKQTKGVHRQLDERLWFAKKITER